MPSLAAPLIFVSLGSAPTSPAAGMGYFDTTLHQFGVYSGTAWVYFSGAAGTSTPFARNLMMALL